MKNNTEEKYNPWNEIQTVLECIDKDEKKTVLPILQEIWNIVDVLRDTIAMTKEDHDV